MKKALIITMALLFLGCTTMQTTTSTLPTSGKKVDVLGVAYNNPLTQDLSVVTLFDEHGKPINSSSTGGPGIVKSTTAQTTQGTTFGVAFPTKGESTSQNTQATAAPVATGGSGTGGAGGAGGKGGSATQFQTQHQQQNMTNFGDKDRR